MAFAERNRELMHSRNPYKRRTPDFAQLAGLYPDFAQHISYRSSDGTAQLDWSDPQLRSIDTHVSVRPAHACATGLSVVAVRAGNCRSLSHALATRLWRSLGAPSWTPVPHGSFAPQLPAVDR